MGLLDGLLGAAGGSTPVGLGISALGALGKVAFGIFGNAKANKIHPQYNPYQVSPYAQQQLGTAQQMFNGRMAGAADEERNIAGSQANFMNNVSHNATDSAQALALGGLAQGQSNNAYNQLGIQEAQNKYSMLQNLNQGYQGMTQEHDKQFQDMWNKYQLDLGVKAATKQAAMQNIFGGAGDLGSMGIMMGNNPASNPFYYYGSQGSQGNTMQQPQQPQSPFGNSLPWKGVLGIE